MKPRIEDKNGIATVIGKDGEKLKEFTTKDHGKSYLSAAQLWLQQNYDKCMQEENLQEVSYEKAKETYHARKKQLKDLEVKDSHGHSGYVPDEKMPEWNKKYQKTQGTFNRIERKHGPEAAASARSMEESSGDAPINQMSHEDLADYIGEHPDWVKDNREKAEKIANKKTQDALEEGGFMMGYGIAKGLTALGVPKMAAAAAPFVGAATAYGVHKVKEYLRKKKEAQGFADRKQKGIEKAKATRAAKKAALNNPPPQMPPQDKELKETSRLKAANYLPLATADIKRRREVGRETQADMNRAAEDEGIPAQFGIPFDPKLHGKHSRQKSVDLAIKKLTGKAKVPAKEEVEYLDELKKDDGILTRYKTAAAASAKAADEQGNFEKGNKRFKGINLATKKQFGHGVKVPATEEAKKDSREYGFEGDMAMSQLRSIMNHAQQLLGMLQPDMDLPEWVQSKITLAQDYVETAANYMQTELQKEAVNPYAVGMAQAMKSTGDTPPLKKSTIIKAHEIAKKIEAKEENSLFTNMLTKLEEGRKKGSKNKPKGENLNTDGKEAEYPGLAMQLAKHADRGELGHGMIEFMDKSKHKISPEHRDLAIRKMSSLTGAGKSPDVRDKMIRDASKSHEGFMRFIGKIPPLAPEVRHPMSAQKK